MMSMLINAFSTGMTQRIVVYRKKKKNVKLTKRTERKKKDYILKLATFLHHQAIITPLQRVNKLIF